MLTKRKTKLMAMLLTLCLLVGIAPVSTLAADTDYDLTVAGVNVTSANAKDVLGDGKVSYDAGTKTLTLNNAKLKTTDTAIYNYGRKAFTVELKGANTITKRDVGEPSVGIGSLGDLTVKGTGNLTVTDLPYGINASFYTSVDGTTLYNVKIEDGVTLTFDTTQRAIYANKPTLSANFTIKAGESAAKATEVSNPAGTDYHTNKYVSISPKYVGTTTAQYKYSTKVVANGKIDLMKGADNERYLTFNKATDFIEGEISDSAVQTVIYQYKVELEAWFKEQQKAYPELANIFDYEPHKISITEKIIETNYSDPYPSSAPGVVIVDVEQTYEVKYTASAHAWSDYQYDDTHHWQTCTVENCNAVNKQPHNLPIGVAPEDIKCLDCGYKLGTVTTYDLWVGGVQVTSANAKDVLGDGKVSYDAGTKTLTLNNANITKSFAKSNGGGGFIKYGIYSDLPLTINLIGNNKVAPADAGYAVSAKDLTVKGTGSLTVQGDYGIETGALTINSGALTVIADGEWGDGILATSLNMTGGSLVAKTIHENGSAAILVSKAFDTEEEAKSAQLITLPNDYLSNYKIKTDIREMFGKWYNFTDIVNENGSTPKAITLGNPAAQEPDDPATKPETKPAKPTETTPADTTDTKQTNDTNSTKNPVTSTDTAKQSDSATKVSPNTGNSGVQMLSAILIASFAAGAVTLILSQKRKKQLTK